MVAGDDVWTRFSADPRHESSSTVRAADADRDVAHEVLGEAFAVGQLNLDEFDERTTAVIESRTLGQLLEIVHDVVPSSAITAVMRSATTDVHDEAVTRYRRDLRRAGRAWVLVTTATVAVWGLSSLISTDLLPFWPILPMLGIGIGWLSVRLTADSRVEDHEAKVTESRRDGSAS